MFDFLFGHKEGEGSKHDILRDIPLDRKLDILVQNSPDAVVISDLKFSILKASKEAARLCGSKSPKDLIGKNTSEYLAKGELRFFMTGAKKFLKTGIIKNLQVRLKKIDGAEYDGIIDAKIIRDIQNQKKYIIAEIRDITDIKKIQEQSIESSQYLKLILENPNVGFYKYDRSLRFTAVNKTICEFLGKNEKDLIGKKILSIGAISVKQAIIAANHIRNLLSGRVKTIVERYDFIDKNGNIAKGIVSSAPLIKNAKIVGVFNIIHDIRREEEEITNIRQSEQLYRTLFDYSQDLLLVLDPKGTIIDVNKVTEEVSGYKKNKLIGNNFRQYVDRKYLPIITKNFISVFAKPQKAISQSLQIEIIASNGKKIPIVLSNKFIPIYKDNKIDRIVVSARDVSSQIAQQKKIIQLENIYKLISDYSGEGIFAYDTKMRFIQINPYAETYIGKKEKYIGHNILRTGLLPLSEIPKALSNAQKLLTGKVKIITDKYHIKKIDGTTIPVKMISSPIYEDKKIIGVTNVVHDLSVEEKLLTDLQKSEELYRNLFIKSKELLIIVDKSGKIIDVNEQVLKSSGYSRNEVISKSISIFVESKLKKDLLRMLSLDFSGIPTPGITIQARKKNGEFFDIQLSPGVVPIYKDNQIVQAMVSARDISDQKKVQDIIDAQQQKYKDLFDNSNDLLIVLDNLGKIVDVNNAIVSILGFTKEDVIGKNVIKFLDPKDIPNAVRYLSMDISGKKSPPIVLHVKTKSKGIIPIEFGEGSVPIQKDGKIIAAMYSGRDLSFRQKAETEIQQSHEMLEKIFSSFDSAIFILDQKSPPTIIDANPATEKIFGYTKEELMGKDTSFLHVDQKHLKKFEEDLFLSLEIGEPFSGYEFQMRKKDNTLFDSEHSVIELTDENKKRIGWISVVRDITSRKAIEKQVEETAKLTNDILDLSPIGIYITSADGQVEFVNKKMLQISGEKEKDFLSFNITQTPSYKKSPVLQNYIHQALTKYVHFETEPIKFTSQISHKTNWRRFIGIPTKKEGKHKLIMMVEDVTESVEKEKFLIQSKEELEKIVSKRTKQLSNTNQDLQKQIKIKTKLEAELRSSQEKFRLLYDYAPEPYLIIDSKGIISELNIATEKLFGRNIKKLKNINILKTGIIHKSDLRYIDDILKHKKKSTVIPEITVCSGKLCKPVELSSFAINIDSQTYYLVVLHDISREKQAEAVLKKSSQDLEKMVQDRTKKLEKTANDLEKEILSRKVYERQIAESEARYKLLFDATNDAIFMFEVTDHKPGKFIKVNENAVKRYGFTHDEFANMTVEKLYDPEDAKKIIPQAMKKLFETKETLFEAVHHTKDGKKIPVEINAHLIEYEGKTTILSSVRDISERYQAQKNIEDKLAEVERMNSLMIGRELRMSTLKDKIAYYETLLKKNNIKYL